MQQTPTRFYTDEGLKTLALLIEYTESQLNYSQNKLSDLAGVSRMTLARIKRGPVSNTPHPDTILQIARVLINPETSRPFDPEELLAVTRGQKKIQFIKGNSMSLRDFAALVSRAFVAWVRQYGLENMGQETQMEEFSKATMISVARLKQIMSPANKLPITVQEIIWLSQVVPSPEGKLQDVAGLTSVLEKI